MDIDAETRARKLHDFAETYVYIVDELKRFGSEGYLHEEAVVQTCGVDEENADGTRPWRSTAHGKMIIHLADTATLAYELHELMVRVVGLETGEVMVQL